MSSGSWANNANRGSGIYSQSLTRTCSRNHDTKRDPGIDYETPKPSWIGWIDSTRDALLVLEAARRGLIPERYLVDKLDLKRIRVESGSMYVFMRVSDAGENPSGVGGWIHEDGLLWSRSIVLGNFEMYWEMEGWDSGTLGSGIDRRDGLGVRAQSSEPLSRTVDEATSFGVTKLLEGVHSQIPMNPRYVHKNGGLVKKVGD
jgi:hypothetical protein